MNAPVSEEKVALLLRRMDSQVANRILQQFAPDRKNRIRTLMQQPVLKSPSDESLDQLLHDLAGSLARPAALRIAAVESVPPDAAAHALPAAEPAPRSGAHAEKDRGLSANDATDDTSADPVTRLRALDIDRLARALDGEHPQTIATILNCLEPQAAGEILKRLPADSRRVAFLRLGAGSSGAADLVPRIVQAIVQKTEALADSPVADSGDAKFQRLADVLKALERTDRMELLTALEEHDSATAVSVKDRLYVFEDLRNIEDRSVQKLLAEIDAKTLATALKGAAEEITQKALNNLSKRGREMVLEEISFLGHVPAAQMHQAQKAVVEVIQRLDQAGELVMVTAQEND